MFHISEILKSKKKVKINFINNKKMFPFVLETGNKISSSS